MRLIDQDRKEGRSTKRHHEPQGVFDDSIRAMSMGTQPGKDGQVREVHRLQLCASADGPRTIEALRGGS